MIMSLLLPLLAHTATPALTPPDVSGLPPTASDSQPAKRRRPAPSASKPTETVAAPAPDATSDRLQTCLHQAQSDPDNAIKTAGDWLSESKGGAKAFAYQCLGAALAQLGSWQEAEYAFQQGREVLPVTETVQRARLAAMAGNAALAEERYDAALASLDLASTGAVNSGDNALIAGIAIDRARALANLGRLAETGEALATARQAGPNNADAWLLSATLARREGKLAEAQGYIEKAAALRPVDLEIGLEAGVIAMLSGREDAARKSWKSVVDADPASPEAQIAQSYIAQLDKP
ncbi:hypothetical protein NT2_04_01730 [Caenibius tardaugens NBRC 16725]|uniref:Uncharacterized protein n=2 Tax=Caenibius TaxID=2827482 RepID=U2Y6G8_9SPHN|nr:hypothetical protein NT2_04_01730 [Caenibius tardaugens NBRC 16725]